MKLPTKKLSCVFLILLGFTPLLAVVALCIKEKVIHHEMMEKLEGQHLQKLAITAKEIVWVDTDEILVHGRMFDIHSISLQNGVYKITGLYDDDETSLREQTRRSASDPEENKLLSQLFKWLQLPYCNQAYDLGILQYGINKFSSFHTSSGSTLCKKIPTPPPDAAATGFLTFFYTA